MSKKASAVPRPRKKAEYEISFATRQASKGWQDLLATTHNALVDAWDFLTKTPDLDSSQNHRLKGELATVTQPAGHTTGGSTNFPAEPESGSTSTGRPST